MQVPHKKAKRMKSIKEKAEAYDNIIKKANKMNSENCEACQICIGELIPELKESEDEKIRKELLQIAKESEDSFYMAMTPNKREKLITWLEKQGETSLNLSNSLNIGKVEPKFHEGEWITIKQ